MPDVFVNMSYTMRMTTVTIRELTRNASSVVEQVTSTGRPALVTKRGTPVAVVLALDADELEDYILANAPEYVASMAAADEAIERGEPGVGLADVMAEFEIEHSALDGEG